MALLAVDIVLLPPDDVTDLAISANKELLKSNPPGITLDKQRCLPHISLDMGLLDEEKLEEAKQLLATIAAETKALDLAITGVTTTVSKEPEVSVLTVEGDGLQRLHEKVADAFSHLLQQGIVENVRWVENQQGEVMPIWEKWVKDFAKNASYEKFRPHITIGLGKVRNPGKIPFIATWLALCHLGNYCTCREVLAEFGLKG